MLGYIFPSQQPQPHQCPSAEQPERHPTCEASSVLAAHTRRRILSILISGPDCRRVAVCAPVMKQPRSPQAFLGNGMLQSLRRLLYLYCPEDTMAIIQLTNRRNDVSPVGQSARERGSPVREPWSALPRSRGPSQQSVPQAVRPCMAIEMSSQVDRGYCVHVPHLSQYRLAAGLLNPMPAQFHLGSL